MNTCNSGTFHSFGQCVVFENAVKPVGLPDIMAYSAEVFIRIEGGWGNYPSIALNIHVGNRLNTKLELQRGTLLLNEHITAR